MLRYLLQFYFVSLIVMGTFAEDYIDTEAEPDPDAMLKCDACTIVARKFGESFVNVRMRPLVLDETIIEAAEATCDDPWEGYGVKEVDGVKRLFGVGADQDVLDGKGVVEMEGDMWVRRLQDMCDELLAEAPDEKTLYKQWESEEGGSESLESYLCKGDGTYSACATENWGPWPGDEYDDYDDDDVDYPHDEF